MASDRPRPIAGVRFPEIVRFTEPRRSFGLVLIAIVLAVIVSNLGSVGRRA